METGAPRKFPWWAEVLFCFELRNGRKGKPFQPLFPLWGGSFFFTLFGKILQNRRNLARSPCAYLRAERPHRLILLAERSRS
jgi:hypothetical protein